MTPLDIFLLSIYNAVIEPIILLLFALAFIIFVWSVVEYIRNINVDAERKKSKDRIIWGLVGMTIMVSAVGIVRIIAGTFGVSPPLPGTTQRIDQTIDQIDVIQ